MSRDDEPRRAEGRLLAALVILATVVTVGAAGWGSLYNETDGQYAGAAKIMAQGGSWLIPENNGIPRLVKPPLLYWTMAASMKIFGVSEFAARLPNALAVAAWTVLAVLIGGRLGGNRTGLLAGAILLTSLGAFTLARIIMPEPMFSAFIAGALYCALRGTENTGAHRRWFLGFWICAALASFTKGWHGALYPLAIVGLAALLCPAARPKLRGWISLPGLLLFAAINLPWYFYVESRLPGFLNNLFFTEQLGHVTGSAAPATDYTSVPRWQFLLLHLAWFFPWSLLAGLVLLRKDARGSAAKLGTALRADFPAALVSSWAFVILISVLLAGQRQDYYAMAMWPAFAIGAAVLLRQGISRPALAAFALLLLAGWIICLALPFVLSPAEAPTAATAERATAWSTVANFGPEVWRQLRTTALAALGGALAFAICALFRRRDSLISCALAALCLSVGAVSGTAIVAPWFSLAPVGPLLGQYAAQSPTLVYDGGLDTGSSLLFYNDLPVRLLGQDPNSEFPVRKFGLGRDRFLSRDELKRLWDSGAPVVLVTESNKLLMWNAFLDTKSPPAGRSGTQVVLKNF